MRSLLPSSTRSTRIAALLLLLPAAAARAEDLESDAVYLPAETTSAMAVRNPLGTVKLQGWDRPQIRIIAHKRAGSRALLERLKVRVDLDGGDVRVTTGFYLSDGAFTPLPLSGGAIDLTIDAPRKIALTALTFSGDIDASGFRAGARLSSQAGQIRASDVEGQVDTRTLNGNQWLEAIRGSLLASGVSCDLALADVEGKRVDASVYKGQITARDVTGTPGAIIRLRTKINVGGASQFPEPGDPSVSVRGATPPGSGLTGYYATYYRNASAAFCPPAT